MPVLHLAIVPQTKEKKKELIEKLTKTVVEATNVPAEAVVVLIDEYSAESIGTGGVQLSGKMKK
jgi:4-oxalocrotonate tautomerase